MQKSMKFLFLFIMSAIILSAKEPDIQLGMWTLSIDTQIPGVSFEIPPATYSSCMKKKDLDPQNYKNMKNCKLLENKITSTSVEGKMQCITGSVKSIYIAKMNYNKTTATGDMKVITGNMVITSKLHAYRTGECK